MANSQEEWEDQVRLHWHNERVKKRMNTVIRVCGKCQTILTKENTGDLQHLQPCCNECTVKYESECNHKFHQDICYLCGYKKDEN